MHLTPKTFLKEIYVITEINDKKKTSKKLNKYITVLNYADKTLLLFSGENSGVSFCSFSTIILLIFMTIVIVKLFLKTMGRETTNRKLPYRPEAC